MHAPSGAGIRARYADRTAELQTAVDRAAAESRRLATVRGVVFVVGLVAFLRAAWPGVDHGPLAAVVAVLSAIGFLALVHRHEVVERRRAELGLRLAFNREGILRSERRWTDLPDHSAPPEPSHPYAADLNVTGHASLLHLIGAWCTPLGHAELRRWLLTPAPPDVVAERQRSIAALAPLDELRETLAARGRPLHRALPGSFSAFTAWSGGEPWFTRGHWRVWLIRGLTALIWAGITLHAGGAVDVALWLPPLVAGWIATAVWRRRTHEAFAAADPGRRLFEGFAPLLETALRVPGEGALARSLASLREGRDAAPDAIRRLESILARADARHMWLHFVLQSLTLWDFHVLAALEGWRRRSGAHADGWLAALADIEALSALALLRFEHPGWCIPVVDSGAEPGISAAGLAHPLIAPDAAVPNDVRLGPPGSVLVITGSNMSGKSTLLRGIGLNAVLAQAGGPVAAAALTLPPTAIATCMRVEDSLEGGVSYFMAELLRLKRVAETVEHAQQAGTAALYLLDEILQGTNTAERRVAAVHVIERLVRSGAVGAVTTHDLELADAEPLRVAAREVHFQEQVDDSRDAMSFDYRLRPGRATSVNALRLMRLVGL